jgi:SAM-dependent methyltransferase
VICDVEHIPFKDRAFEAVVARDLLHHVGNPERAIGEMWRVTEGEMEVWESNRRNPYMWTRMILSDFAHDHFTPPKFRRLFLGYPASFDRANNFEHFVGFERAIPKRLSSFIVHLYRMASSVVPSYNVAHLRRRGGPAPQRGPEGHTARPS